MKAIIISDDSNVISKLNDSLIEFGFDTIIYRWLLKALDNIEEIRPDLVIVSASEYPRHWKTLSQYITSGIGGDNTKVFLFNQNPMNEEDSGKAKALGIKGFINSLEEDGLAELKNLLSEYFPVKKEVAEETPSKPEPEAAAVEFPETESEAEEDFDIPTVSSIQETHKVSFNPDEACMIFQNPKTGNLITGSVVSYENKTAHFTPDYPELAENLSSGDTISLVTFKLEEKLCNYRGEVLINNGDLLMKLEEING